MGKGFVRAFLSALLLALLVPHAWIGADTVVLTDGARLAGRVSRNGREVTIRSGSGTLALPLWRVARIEPDSAGVATQGPGAAPAAEAAAAAPEAHQPAEAVPARPGPPAVADVLKRRIDIDFQDAPLADVLKFVREVTDVNMAVAPEVRADLAPVTLRLRNMPVETILDLILEPRGYGYSVRPGEVIYVRAAPGERDYVLWIYDVRDLLVSTQDRGVGGQAGLGGQGALGGIGGGTGGQGLLGSGRANAAGQPQFAPGAGAGGLQLGAQPQGVQGGLSRPLSARAGDLVLLIKATCGEGTWMDPASSGLIAP
jgi:hypothetical protein